MTRAGASPASFAATATAHAPLPQAIVSPLPRSQTRTSIRSPSTRANSTFVPSGNRSWRSSAGPMCPTWYRAGSSSTNSTRCGFPIETALAVRVMSGPISNGWPRNVSQAGPRIGIEASVKFAGPIPTVTDRTPPSSVRSSRRFTPARVATSNVRPSTSPCS